MTGAMACAMTRAARRDGRFGQLIGDSLAMRRVIGRLLSAAFLDRLAHHGWPGNIRELRNTVDRALAMGPWEPEAEIIPDAPDPWPSVPPAPAVDLSRPFKQARDEWTARFERAYLAALLEHHAGSIRRAARAAGIDRVHLYRLLARHGLGRG